MQIVINFDVEKCAIFIPDGYVHNTNQLQLDFIDWCHNQPESVTIAPGEILAYRYTKELFLRYINEELIIDSSEIAYFIDIHRVNPKHRTLSF